MNDLLLLWLSLSLSGSLVALAILLLKPIFQKLGRAWQYYIWLLVLLRLLIPYNPQISLLGFLFQQTENRFGAQASPEEAFLKISPTASQNAPVPENRFPEKKPAPSRDDSFLWNNSPLALWLMTAAFLLIRKIYGYGKFINAVKKESRVIHTGPLPSMLKEVCLELNVRKSIAVCTNPLVRAPLLAGIRKPMIVLPPKEIPITDLKHIFRHELTHYRRKDLLYKWLTEITVCLHWFNPFVYLVRKQINRECEFSCDEAVISHLSLKDRRAYGETLLNSVTTNHSHEKNLILLSLSEDGKRMKERLDGIMKYKRKSKLAVCMAALLTAALFCGTVYTGAYTKAEDSAKGSVKVNEASADSDKTASIVYESVELMYYPSDGKKVYPYIHDIRTNNTSKTIVETERGMLAYDKAGNPLKIDWNGLDSSQRATYYFLYDWDDSKILPGRTENLSGGWSLNETQTDKNVKKIAYVLYCDKKVTFSDGTVWKNPEYAAWLKKYRKKKISVKQLKSYYPYVQEVE